MDALEKSFDSAGETSKLLITLSTGVIAFCVTVTNIKESDKTLLTPMTSNQKWILVSSWFFLLISIGIGVWTQLAITHVLSEENNSNPPSAWNRKITVPFQLQIFTFLLGIIAVMIYGTIRIFG